MIKKVLLCLLCMSLVFPLVLRAGELDKDERMFREAYREFQKENYTGAVDTFKRLIKDYPESSRRLDALYFLDKIKLFYRGQNVPVIRVLLAAQKKYRNRVMAPMRVSDGKKTLKLRRGDEWKATVSNEKVFFQAKDIITSDKIVLESLENDQHLSFNGGEYRGKLELEVFDGKLYVINRIPLNYYLYGVIKKEIAPGWPIETVKAQAVAARSFAIYRIQRNIDESYDLGTTWLAQLYGGVEAETPRVIKAVEETKGEVITHRGVVVPGFFHANSGGYIETGQDVWEGTPTPYIISGEDTWSVGVQHHRWSELIKLEEINKGLREKNYPAMGRGNSLLIEQRLKSGRAAQFSYITKAGQRHQIRADRFRLAVGPGKMLSTWLLKIEPTGEDILFEGLGWGHGVGMSQWGAWNMGQKGIDYQSIINFYYKGAQLAANYGPGVVSSVP